MRWVIDACTRPLDQAWLDYQQEIGLRHTRAKKHRTDRVNSPDHIPLRYLLSSYGLGLRQGEALALCRSRIDFQHHTYRVDRQVATYARAGSQPCFAPPKTKASRRTIPIPAFVETALHRHIDQFVPDGDDRTRHTLDHLWNCDDSQSDLAAQRDPTRREDTGQSREPAANRTEVAQQYGTRGNENTA